VRFARKNIRLPSGSYIGQRLYFVTICCEQRRPIFADAQWVSHCLANLKKTSAACGFALHAFCFMPDHVHLLAEGLGVESSLRTFLSRFKQVTGFEYRQRAGKKLWQAKYYDYVLRKDVEMEGVACYIWMNPVRKGLGAASRDYPHSGSMTMPWPQIPRATSGEWAPPWKQNNVPG
jgi:putative transposase